MPSTIFGANYGGANLTPANGDVLSGTFTNVGQFLVSGGTTVFEASGVALSAVALGALILHRAFGWWWVDPSSALAIAAILAWQGSLTLRQWASSLSSTSASG